MKTISLVLGSGGARGLTHIGVIHWLEENGFKISSIAGSSIGALVGGIYAAGKLFDAIRASMSISLFFTPFRYKGLDLIDGGVLNPVPVAPTIGDITDFTVAVNLGGPSEGPEESAGVSAALAAHPSALGRRKAEACLKGRAG